MEKKLIYAFTFLLIASVSITSIFATEFHRELTYPYESTIPLSNQVMGSDSLDCQAAFTYEMDNENLAFSRPATAPSSSSTRAMCPPTA